MVVNPLGTICSVRLMVGPYPSKVMMPVRLRYTAPHGDKFDSTEMS